MGGIEQQFDAQQDLQRRVSVLQNLYDLKFANGIPEVVGQVVDFGTSDFAETIDIGRGTSSGIDVGMPVVSGQGLMGDVISASSSQATIQLITDPSLSVSVRYGTKGSLAVVQGQGTSRNLAVHYIAPRTSITKGDVYTTSGLGGSFPEGIPVARTTSISTSVSSLEQNVEATPLASLTDPQYVAVLLWEPAP
jgi:rod shape-determining protein MreC